MLARSVSNPHVVSLYVFFVLGMLRFRLFKLQEFFVKKKDRVEVLSMMGAFGFIVSLLQLYPFSLIVFITRCFLCFLALIVYVRSILELENIKSIKWSADLVSKQN